MPESNSFSKDSTLQIAVLQSYSLDIQSDRCNYLAINDGGSMIDIIPYRMAVNLVQKGIVKEIEKESECWIYIHIPSLLPNLPLK